MEEPRYWVESVQPAGDYWRAGGSGALYVDVDGSGYASGASVGQRTDDQGGTVSGVPEAVEDRFARRFFTARELEALGARQVLGRWLFHHEGADYELRVFPAQPVAPRRKGRRP